MKVAKTVLLILGISIAGYALFSEEPSKVMPFVLLTLGCFMILKSVYEFKKVKHPYVGLFQLAVGVVAIYAFFQAFMVI
ncbi:hypothetical protein SAMN05216353_13917 [Halobacillus alkaliphilus]|uniref:DUF3953 domain-containing protein n=1 Tax=Halobacillus alkaliphilus TaxID=396056 RepID=A0A1I2RLJ5_9BACI|nr:hypothetical protein [Halobacillus alkaliphilus]SFG38646.1 hypothetical protein SAMN05216353_13917 [Halobacillus alkaliphilus]